MKNNFKRLAHVLAIALAISSCSKSGDNTGSKTTTTTTTTTTTSVPTDLNWSFESTPSFADEFSTAGAPDTSKWTYDIGGNGWGNNELEYYTNSTANANVANGMLSITAKKEAYQGKNYTSARMVSKGTGSLTYGRIEVRAMLPSGRGTWPSIWLLPNDYAYGNWPASGEVDIMEMVGYDPNMVYFTIHNQQYNGAMGTQKGGSMVIPTASTDFHKYRVDWTPYAIRGYYDDNLVFTYVNGGFGSSYWPYDQKFHLLMNIAVGGNWGGAKGVDDNAFPTAMVVDYVHFYKMIPK